MSTAASLLKSSPMRWAVGGWSFFIAENVVLSENRTWLINKLGDDGYHTAYGTCSTVAVCSIAYAYLKKIPKLAAPLRWPASSAVPAASRLAACTCLSLGLTLASQTLPKMQIPVRYVGAEASERSSDDPSSSEASSKRRWRVQCPFDFIDAKAHMPDDTPRGVERISRHPGLWSMGLACLGHGLLLPSVPQRIFWSMPILVAWIGGSHTDSRYRRNMGGMLSSEYDADTSNVPFLGIIVNSIRRGDAEEWKDLGIELKLLNALLATGMATAWAIRRGRVPKVVVSVLSRP